MYIGLLITSEMLKKKSIPRRVNAYWHSLFSVRNQFSFFCHVGQFPMSRLINNQQTNFTNHTIECYHHKCIFPLCVFLFCFPPPHSHNGITVLMMDVWLRVSLFRKLLIFQTSLKIISTLCIVDLTCDNNVVLRDRSQECVVVVIVEIAHSDWVRGSS